MKKSSAIPICDLDCFHCRFDDCINDELTAADYVEARALEAYIRPSTQRQEAKAAYNREYYEANKEAIAAYKREYYEANKEAKAAYNREYYEANKEAIAAYQRKYYEANKEAIAAYQRKYYEANRRQQDSLRTLALRQWRLEHGYRQSDLAALLGVTQSAICRWESGAIPIPQKVQDMIDTSDGRSTAAAPQRGRQRRELP